MWFQVYDQTGAVVYLVKWVAWELPIGLLMGTIAMGIFWIMLKGGGKK